MLIWETIKAFFSNKDSVISVAESPTVNTPAIKVTDELVEETYNNMLTEAKNKAKKVTRKKTPAKKTAKKTAKKKASK